MSEPKDTLLAGVVSEIEKEAAAIIENGWTLWSRAVAPEMAYTARLAYLYGVAAINKALLAVADAKRNALRHALVAIATAKARQDGGLQTTFLIVNGKVNP